MGITSSRKQPFALLWSLIVLGLLISLFFFKLKNLDLSDYSVSFFFGLVLIVISIGLTVLLFFAITSVFGFTNFKKGFLNFIIGDNGRYSLSRLQAVGWAMIIIAAQFSVIICLCINPHLGFSYYDPIFSESEIWLLGLSLGSSIAVKGITVNNAVNNPRTAMSETVIPRLQDILSGDNGLDFSRCQMFIWTLLAAVVFLSKVFFFNQAVFLASADTISKLTTHFYDDYGTNILVDKRMPYVPYLPWSFIVLMGLSQGVYVGKKLVPSFKLADMRSDKQQQLIVQKTELEKKKVILDGILKVTQADQRSAIDQASVAVIQKDIDGTQELIDGLSGDINQINAYLN
jgi:hypothetical protein